MAFVRFAIARCLAPARVYGGLREARTGRGTAQLRAVSEHVLMHEPTQVVLVERGELHVCKIYGFCRDGFGLA